jgi:predicted ATPase/DNA-binding winged helix-turn-helix (wHTH) protein
VSEASANLVYVCDQWEIDLGRRELRSRGIPVPLGGRAFEVVTVLVQSATELVTKDHMMEQVWPGAVVGEATIHVHISAVRKALGPDRAMLKTVSGRGYRLLGSWTPQQREGSAPPVYSPLTRTSGAPPANNFPPLITRLIGRAAACQFVRDLVSAYRVVTLTGPGGIGKTSLAIKVVRYLLPDFEDGGWIVELASLSDPGLVPSTVAGTLGLKLGGEISAESVARAVGGRHLVLVLDNCEHVIDAVANLAETFTRLCPRTTIVATSREVLRIDGESVYRVPPLEVPALGQGAPDYIMQYSAVELFVARTKALNAGFSPTAENLASIATICRHLDGIPLAIEFAAARAAVLTVQLVVAGLHDRFALLTAGRRTALPRQRTLRATLDWSHELLTDAERRLLRRLAVFAGGFTVDAAAAVMTDTGFDASAVLDGIANLVAKSWVALDKSGAAARWTLLETIRAYALEKLAEHAEADIAAEHHALYFRDLFTPQARGVRSSLSDEDLARCVREIDNVRAALEWCFGAHGDAQVGIVLAAAVAPVFLAMSLVAECNRWSERAILALDDDARGGLQEMQLQAALGVSLIFTRGGREAARLALVRGLAIAEDRGDVLEQVRLLGPLSMFHRRSGEYNTALQYAKRCSALARTTEDPVAIVLAHSNLGLSLQPVGELTAARTEFEAAIARGSDSLRNATIYFGMDGNVLAGAALAMNLWLEGHPAQAIERACQTIQEAARTDHAVSISTALLNAISVLLWAGDLASASEHIDMLISRAESHSFGPFGWLGRGFKGEVAIRRGDVQGGVEALKGSLEQLHQARFNLFTSTLSISLIQGLVTMGRHAEAIALAGDTIRLAAANGIRVFTPELLRVKGRALLATGRPNVDAEMCFVQSLELSRRQGARAWELRSATDLAALWARLGRSADARALLLPAFEQFTEGLDTADLVAAERLLTTLS